MPACGSWPTAVPLAAYRGGVVRSAVVLFTSRTIDVPGAPAAWLPANRTYLLALFTCRNMSHGETHFEPLGSQKHTSDDMLL